MKPTPSIAVERGAVLTALRRCHLQIFRSWFGAPIFRGWAMEMALAARS
jgi:hypothetical protein